MVHCEVRYSRAAVEDPTALLCVCAQLGSGKRASADLRRRLQSGQERSWRAVAQGDGPGVRWDEREAWRGTTLSWVRSGEFWRFEEPFADFRGSPPPHPSPDSRVGRGRQTTYKHTRPRHSSNGTSVGSLPSCRAPTTETTVGVAGMCNSLRQMHLYKSTVVRLDIYSLKTLLITKMPFCFLPAQW